MTRKRVALRENDPELRELVISQNSPHAPELREHAAGHGCVEFLFCREGLPRQVPVVADQSPGLAPPGLASSPVCAHLCSRLLIIQQIRTGPTFSRPSLSSTVAGSF